MLYEAAKSNHHCKSVDILFLLAQPDRANDRICELGIAIPFEKFQKLLLWRKPKDLHIANLLPLSNRATCDQPTPTFLVNRRQGDETLPQLCSMQL